MPATSRGTRATFEFQRLAFGHDHGNEGGGGGAGGGEGGGGEGGGMGGGEGGGCGGGLDGGWTKQSSAIVVDAEHVRRVLSKTHGLYVWSILCT